MYTATPFSMIIHIAVLMSATCHAYHIVYLDEYMGNLMLIELPDLNVDNPTLDLSTATDITPNGLQCGNPDVSPDGTTIIFGAITPDPESWDIYMGDLNIVDGRIDNLTIIINTNLREEDPRFSYDGASFVYKAGISWVSPVLYDIVLYDIMTQTSTTIVECPSDCGGVCASSCDHCELWGPAYHPCGNQVSYTARICENSVNVDEIYVYDIDTQQKTRVTNNGIPDMYSHWKRDGTLLFSRKYNGADHLYLYDPNTANISLYLAETGSDDDAYAFKQDNALFLFIGFNYAIEGYELYVSKDGAVMQLTAGKNMLGPVVFSTDIAVTTPDYCDASNPVTTEEATAVSTEELASTTDEPDATTTEQTDAVTTAKSTRNSAIRYESNHLFLYISIFWLIVDAFVMIR